MTSTTPIPVTDTAAATSASSPLQLTVHPASSTFWSGDSPSFKDMLDTVNPLQHLPILSTLYRNLTGSSISAGAQIAGNTLYGGPLGLLSGILNEIVQTQTGQDIVGNALNWVEGKNSTQTASASDDSGNSEPFMSPNQRMGYNAYVQMQNQTA